nr:integrase, catalytic region, zinc finger, CCHC-type, peptidase aspartic, catalytic [Tanacetum cinerariifolium]
MSTSTHPIIILSDSDVEDAFYSTNTPDYTSASPNYSPASLRNTASDSKTESDPSEDPFEDHSALLAISPFHDDPYIKVMQAYNATSNESSIPPLQALITPPTVLPPSPVLLPLPLFDPEDFFLPEEILPPQKRAHFLSSSFIDSSAPPYIFKTRENSHVTHLKCHKEHIDAIPNHLDELSLERIEHMEDKIEGPGFLKLLYLRIMDMVNDQDIEHIIPPTPPRDPEPLIGPPISLSPSSSVGSLSLVRMAPKRTSTSAALAMTYAAIKTLVTDSVGAALEIQAAPIENTKNTNRNTRQSKTHVARKCSYKEFMSCQPFNFKGVGYLCTTMVPNYEKLMEVFIGGLPKSIEGNVTALKPQTLEEAITITQRYAGSNPVGNKMHKAFPLPVIEFPLAEEVPTASEENSHCQKKRDATAKRIALLVIKFGDSYDVPASADTTETPSGKTGKKTGRTVTVTTEDMQKRKNDVKARTTLLLGNEDVNTASVFTASTNVPTAIANNGVASISQDTACTYIASQSSGKKISIQGLDVARFDKSKVECFNCHKMGYFARECRASRSQDKGRRDNYRQGSKVEEQAPKALMAIDGDLSWTGLLEFADDTVTNYSRPSPTMESTLGDDQNRNPSISKTDALPSTIKPKPFIKFVKPNGSPSKSKTCKTETPKKPLVKYAEQYYKSNKKPNVRGNQRNWNNLKSHQLGPNFVMKKKACFNCGDFNHLAYDYRKRVKKGTSRSQNDIYESFTPRPVVHKTYRPPVKPIRSNMNVRSQFSSPWVPTANRNFPPVSRKFSSVSRNFPTVNRKFPTANRKFFTSGTKFSTADMGKKGKAIKPSACWFWKALQNLSNKGPNSNSVSMMFKKYTYIDTQGRLKSVMAWVPKENKSSFSKFVRDIKYLAKEANESLAKHKALELEIERVLRAVDSQNIMSVVQNNSVGDTSNLQTELERTKERFKNCIIKKENEYAKLWNDWYKKCEECKYDKILYDKAYNDMQQKIERLQAQLGDLKGKRVDNTAMTRRLQPRSNTKNDRVPFASKSCCSKNKEVEVEENLMNLLLSKIRNICHLNVIQICLWCVDAGCSKHMTRNLKLLINFVWNFLGTVCFGNDHIAAILGFSDLQWGNIVITRVYFIEGLGHNLFSVGQFCDSDLEVAFRRNTCFVRNLEGVDLLKGNRTTNLYTNYLHEMALVSPMYLMARDTYNKSWLWHQRLTHLNFDTINDLAKNDLVIDLLKFKYHKEHICPSSIATACFNQNRSIIHRRFNKTPYELINGRKPDISFLPVFGALCYPKNDRKDFGKLDAKGDIGFFIGYSANSCAYRVYNRMTKKIMEIMNVTFDELLAIDFDQSSKLDLMFEAMYDDYIGGQPLAAPRTVLAAQAPQARKTPTMSTSIADTTLTLTNLSSQATNFPNTSQDVDGLKTQQHHAQQQGNQAPLQPETVAD